MPFNVLDQIHCSPEQQFVFDRCQDDLSRSRLLRKLVKVVMVSFVFAFNIGDIEDKYYKGRSSVYK